MVSDTKNMTSDGAIYVKVLGKVAIIYLNVPDKLNALTQDRYYALASALREVAGMDDIYITVLTGKGRYFSAYVQSSPNTHESYTNQNVSSGADVSIPRQTPSDGDTRRAFLKNFVAGNLEITNAFYTHPKILITALNGPAIGLSAALISMSDFIYAAPHAFLLTPFTSLGLVAEGGSSVAFVQRLGISKANEALIMSKRLPVEELVSTGFVNKVFQVGKDEDEKFVGLVLKEINERLGDNLNNDSLLQVKALIRKPQRDTMDAQNLAEVMGGLERFAAGIPQEEFRKIASGQKKHKL